MGTESKKSEGTTSSTQKETQGCWNATILAAVITAITAVTVALIPVLFNFPPFQRLFDPAPTPTNNISVISAPLTNEPPPSETPVAIPTETPVFISPAETATSISTSTPGLPLGMQVILSATRTSGRPPLKVGFDARDSYFRDKTGAIFPCGACNFTWQIRMGSDIVFGPEKKHGTFEFTFTARGTYFVSVYVCRTSSTDCNGSGTQIIVR